MFDFSYRLCFQQVAELPSIDLVRLRDGNATTLNIYNENSEVGARADGFLAMLDKFVHTVSLHLGYHARLT